MLYKVILHIKVHYIMCNGWDYVISNNLFEKEELNDGI